MADNNSFLTQTTRANIKTLMRNNLVTAVVLTLILYFLKLEQAYQFALFYAAVNLIALISYKMRWPAIAGYLAIYSIFIFSSASSVNTGALASPFLIWLLPVPLLSSVILGFWPTVVSTALSLGSIFVLSFYSFTLTQPNILDRSGYAFIIVMFVSIIVAVFQIASIGLGLTRNIVFASNRIEKASESRKKLLDALKEGIFFIAKDGSISKQRSKSLAKHIPESAEFMHAKEFFASVGKRSEKDIQTILDLLFDVDDGSGFVSDFSTTITMLPREWQTLDSQGQKTDLRLTYTPINDSEFNLEQVLVIVEDITQEKEEHKKSLAQKSANQRLSKAAQDLETYQHFVNDAQGIFSRLGELQAKDFGSAEPARDLHTLKGNLSVFSFSEIADCIHTIESCLADKNIEKVAPLWQEAMGMWVQQTESIHSALNLDRQKNYDSIAKFKIKDLAASIDSEKPYPDLKEQMANLNRSPLNELFVKYEDYVHSLEERFPDKAFNLTYSQKSKELNHQEIARFDEAIIHILRNCLDHGLESKQERQKLNKPKAGVITLGFERSKTCLELTIQDDGKGIPGDILADKAVGNKIWEPEKKESASWQEKIELIFHPGLSSAEEVTNISGRGVGMDAVKHNLDSQGGSIRIDSELQKGTRFTLKLPVHETSQSKRTMKAV